MLASMFMFAVPVVGKVIPAGAGGERQIVTYGNLHNETFPEWNFTYWEKQGVELGFTSYGEMVTDQDPFGTDTKFGVGLSYPAGDELVAEHIATPSGAGGVEYWPIEGWQLFWKWNATKEPVLAAVDPEWHIHMAIYGNESAEHNMLARIGVKDPETLIITNTSRLFAARVTMTLYNDTLAVAPINANPNMFELRETLVFFKDTKKIVQYWDLEYLGSKGGVNVVFRRLTNFDVDEKYQAGYEAEGFAAFFPNSGNATKDNSATDVIESYGSHVFWTGCDYWPQNYSLAVVWTNSSISHWAEPDASHHVGFVAYFPNCSNWNTDDWNYYMYDLWPFRTTAGRAAWFALDPPGSPRAGPLSARYGGQPKTRQPGENLLMGQWNFTLTTDTNRRKAQFVNVIGITNCSDTFGYVGKADKTKYSGDWDSEGNLGGGRTISEIKYLLSEVFNATYKLSSDWHDYEAGGGDFQDLTEWYPFSGTSDDTIVYMWNNTWLKRKAGQERTGRDTWNTVANPRNTTFIYGESAAHNGMLFTSEAAHVVDVVGGTEVGEAFGSYVSDPLGTRTTDPWWEALWDTTGFTEGSKGPFYGTAPNFYKTVAGKDYLDGSGEYVPLSWKFSGFRRVQNKTFGTGGSSGDLGEDWDLFTTPTGFYWDVNHTIVVGGPKVNLAAEYFNDHTWAIWTSSASGCEIPDLASGGIYVFPSGNYYGKGYSVITICDDLNLTSQRAIYDEEKNRWITGNFSTDPNLRTGGFHSIMDGPTVVDPFAALLIWGYSGWDTRSACNWLAQHWVDFTTLYTNATDQPETGVGKKGVTTLILYTPKIAEVYDYDYMYGVREVLGPAAGRWRYSVGAWDLWIAIPCSLDWNLTPNNWW